MCGRFALSAPAVAIQKHFGLSEEVALPPRYNIAPGQDVAVVKSTGDTNHLVMMRWGLIPSWAKESRIGYKMINARSETLHEKPSFRTLCRSSRCLIPANGFYEWKPEPGKKDKQPYFIRMKDESLFAFAGLWSSWTSKSSGENIKSCIVITTEPNSLLSGIHNRMPVIVRPDQYFLWLHPQSSPGELSRLFAPFDPGMMAFHPVSTLCNSTKNDSPQCMANPATGW